MLKYGVEPYFIWQMKMTWLRMMVCVCLEWVAGQCCLGQPSAEAERIVRQATHLADSKSEADRMKAAMSLDQYPMFFGSQLFLTLSKKLATDKAKNVRTRALYNLYFIADAAYPAEPRENQVRLLEELLTFLHSIRDKPGYDQRMTDALIQRISENPMLEK